VASELLDRPTQKITLDRVQDGDLIAEDLDQPVGGVEDHGQFKLARVHKFLREDLKVADQAEGLPNAVPLAVALEQLGHGGRGEGGARIAVLDVGLHRLARKILVYAVVVGKGIVIVLHPEVLVRSPFQVAALILPCAT